MSGGTTGAYLNDRIKALSGISKFTNSVMTTATSTVPSSVRNAAAVLSSASTVQKRSIMCVKIMSGNKAT